MKIQSNSEIILLSRAMFAPLPEFGEGLGVGLDRLNVTEFAREGL